MATDEKHAITFSERMLSLRQKQYNAQFCPVCWGDGFNRIGGHGNFTEVECTKCGGTGKAAQSKE